MSEGGYERQLEALFSSFDRSGIGALGREQLRELCVALHLGVQLERRLLPDPGSDELVTFPQFRAALLSLLAASPAPSAGPDKDLSGDESSGREVSPKFTFGSKKYGRRSRPVPLCDSPDFRSEAPIERVTDSLSQAHSSTAPGNVTTKKRKTELRLRRCISYPDERHIDKTEEEDADGRSRSLGSPADIEERCHHKECDSPDSYEEETITRVPVLLGEEHITCEAPGEHFSQECFETTKTRSIADMWESSGIIKPYDLLADLGFESDELNIGDLLKILEEEITAASSNSRETTERNSPTTLLRAAARLYRYETANVKITLNQTIAERDKLKSDLSDANRRAILLADDIDENHTKLEAQAKAEIETLERKHAETIQRMILQSNTEKELAANVLADLEERLTIAALEDSKLRSRTDELKQESEKIEKDRNELIENLSQVVEINKKLTKELKVLSDEKRGLRDIPQIDEVALEEKITKLQNENTSLRDKNDELCAELENISAKLSNRSFNLKSDAITTFDIYPEAYQSEDEHAGLTPNTSTPYTNGIKRRGISPSQSPTQLSNEGESPRICKVRKCHDGSPVALGANLSKSAVLLSTSIPITNENYHSVFSNDSNYNNGIVTNDISNKERLDHFCLASNAMEEVIQHLKEKMCNNLLHIMAKSNYKYNYLVFYYLICIIKDDIKDIFDIKNVTDKDHLDSDSLKSLQLCIKEMDCLNRDLLLGKIFQKTKICNIVYNDEISVSKLIDSNDNKSDVELELKRIKEILDNEIRERNEECVKHAEKCKEYETNIESLKNVYEECEEYWALKFKEEREIFEQEQQISDEKFSDLMNKVAEYEEQFGLQASKNDFCSRPLSTIEEKCTLEKQFNDLEDEFQEYKTKIESQIEAKNEEIKSLKEKLTALQHSSNTRIISHSNNSMSSDSSSENNSISSRKTENANRFPNNINTENKENAVKSNAFDTTDIPTIASPIEYLWNQKTISAPLSNIRPNNDKVRDYQNPIFLKEQALKCNNASTKSPVKSNERDNSNQNNYRTPIQKPLTLIKPPTVQNQDNISYAKSLETKMEGKILHCSELEEVLKGRRKDLPDMEATRTKLNPETRSLNDQRSPSYQESSNSFRANLLEVRCRQLQSALRQQQLYNEAVMQQTLAAHRGEVGALRQKLAATDLLVRDLYVENCHLTGSIVNPPI